ncbi:hypothetical protein X768_31775 [Mesorhizobium sp. LSJC265A00]|nr:hypothetical protein X768_31775 [Mesorhizobium sp. LSJC265A00]
MKLTEPPAATVSIRRSANLSRVSAVSDLISMGLTCTFPC